MSKDHVARERAILPAVVGLAHRKRVHNILVLNLHVKTRHSERESGSQEKKRWSGTNPG
jgi:hypothetical protein